MAKEEPIHRRGFQFDGTFTTVSGVSFEAPEILRRLCFPNDPEQWKVNAKKGRGRPRKMTPIKEEEAEKLLSKKFIIAQCRFYGITAPYAASAQEAVEIFKKQVGAGKVRQCIDLDQVEYHVSHWLQFRYMASKVEKLWEEMAGEWEVQTGVHVLVIPQVLGRRPGRPKGNTTSRTVAQKPVQFTRKNALTTTNIRKVPISDPKRDSSIVGSYRITCYKVQSQWPDLADDLSLNIFTSSTPGVYEASFNFGVLEGIMMLSADKAQLMAVIADIEGEEADVFEDQEADTPVGGKRKASSGISKQLSKKAKLSGSTMFFFQWRGCETSEGEILFGEYNGTMQFTQPKNLKFTGNVNMAVIGRATFEGKRTSKMPRGQLNSWGDFS